MWFPGIRKFKEIQINDCMNNLNDDCLINIFEYLNEKEKIKIKWVSKR